jgi:hypothetical protein
LNFEYSAQAEEDTLAVMMRCAFFAAHKHRNQRRKNADETPYINHPLGNELQKVCQSFNQIIIVQAWRSF